MLTFCLNVGLKLGLNVDLKVGLNFGLNVGVNVGRFNQNLHVSAGLDSVEM